MHHLQEKHAELVVSGDSTTKSDAFLRDVRCSTKVEILKPLVKRTDGPARPQIVR